MISIKAAVDNCKQPFVDHSWAHAGPNGPEHKFFGNFPYPYMNGMLHLGHAFSLSKVSHPDGLPHALSCSSQHIVWHTLSNSAAWADTIALRAAAGVCLGFSQAVRQAGPVPTGLPLHRHAYQGAPQRSTQVDPQALQHHQNLRVLIRLSLYHMSSIEIAILAVSCPLLPLPMPHPRCSQQRSCTEPAGRFRLQACADKLDRELNTYGCPPVFPTEDEEPAAQQEVRSSRPGSSSGVALYCGSAACTDGVMQQD